MHKCMNGCAEGCIHKFLNGWGNGWTNGVYRYTDGWLELFRSPLLFNYQNRDPLWQQRVWSHWGRTRIREPCPVYPVPQMSKNDKVPSKSRNSDGCLLLDKHAWYILLNKARLMSSNYPRNTFAHPQRWGKRLLINKAIAKSNYIPIRGSW